MAVALYGVVLLAILALFRGCGEWCWPVSVLLYFPVQIWFLPLVLLVPAAWFFARWLLVPLAALLLVGVFGLAGLRWGAGARPVAAGARAITVLTNNIGESNHKSMAPFVEAQHPDLIVLQDALRRASIYRRVYPGWHVASADEFILISRFPILSATPLPHPKGRRALGAAFRVDWPDHPFTMYAVHMLTPRSDFAQLRGHGFLVETVRGRGLPFQRFATYKEAMRKRVEMATELAGILASDPGPVLVAGDFNMPSWGALHSMFSSRLTDAFTAAGWGFGLTFPGYTRNPLSLFGPWLRLDYLFCNRAWTPVACTTEPNRASQHRAVAATFEWAGNGH